MKKFFSIRKGNLNFIIGCVITALMLAFILVGFVFTLFGEKLHRKQRDNDYKQVAYPREVAYGIGRADCDV